MTKVQRRRDELQQRQCENVADEGQAKRERRRANTERSLDRFIHRQCGLDVLFAAVGPDMRQRSHPATLIDGAGLEGRQRREADRVFDPRAFETNTLYPYVSWPISTPATA